MRMSDDRSRFGWAGEDRIDRAIDRAVRAIMHTDPPPGLRRRVLSRLEAPPARRSLGAAFGFAAAAAVLVLVTIVITRSGPAPAVPQQAAREGAPAAAPAPVPQPAPEPPSPAPARQPERTRPIRDDGTIAMPRVGNVFGPPTGRVSSATVAGVQGAAPPVDPGIPDAAPGELTPSQSGGVAPLQIAPLEVKPIQVPPIGSGPRR